MRNLGLLHFAVVDKRSPSLVLLGYKNVATSRKEPDFYLCQQSYLTMRAVDAYVGFHNCLQDALTCHRKMRDKVHTFPENVDDWASGCLAQGPCGIKEL